MNLGDKYSSDFEEKVDRRQWVPVIGLCQVVYDNFKGKPTLFDYEPTSKFVASAAVHGTGLAGLSQLIHYLIH